MKWVNPYQQALDNGGVDDDLQEEFLRKAVEVEKLLASLEEGDSELYNYIENLIVTNEEGEVIMSVLC